MDIISGVETVKWNYMCFYMIIDSWIWYLDGLWLVDIVRLQSSSVGGVWDSIKKNAILLHNLINKNFETVTKNEFCCMNFA